MPINKSNSDAMNNANKIPTFEAYEEPTSRLELYSQIKEGMDDITTGNTRPLSDAMTDIRSRRRRRECQ